MDEPRHRRGAGRHALRLGAMLRPHAAPLVAATACMLGLALATVLYAWLCGPLLKYLFLSGDAPALPVELARALGALGFGASGLPSRDALRWALPALLVGVALLKGLCDLGQRTLMGAVGLRLVARLRLDLFDRLLMQRPSFVAERREGDLLSALVGDTARVEEAATTVAQAFFRDVVQVLALAALVVWLDPRLALVTALVLPFAAATIGAVGRVVRRAALGGQEALGDLSAASAESLRHLRVIKALGAEERMRGVVAGASASYTRRALRALRWRATGPAVMELLGGGGLAAVIGYATARIAAGTLAPETFVSLFAGVLLLYQPVKSLSRLHGTLQAGGAALDRIAPLLQAPGEPPDRPGARVPAGASGALGVRWDDVHLARGGRPVLRGVTLDVAPGEIVAIVGPAGAGKTTLVDLALRLLDPDAGAVRLAGLDAADLPKAWIRRRVAVVPQEPLLLRGTVASNVAFPEERPDPARLARAVRASGLDALVSRLPGGLDAPVGEGGATLSGGERQRVAIARALYRDAGLLLLDEATSALDAASEDEVRRAIRALAPACTVVLVAHRLSTARVADRVAVLDDGRVREVGPPRDLDARGGAWATLWSLQSGAAAPEAS